MKSSELTGPPAQDQRGAAVILPAPDMDTVEDAGLADCPVRAGHQLLQFSLIADREADAGQGRRHVITFHYARKPRRRLTRL